MNNKILFIESYLSSIAKQFDINKDEAFEVFSIAAVLDRSFQEVYNSIVVHGSKDGGIDGVYFEELEDGRIMHVFQCKNQLRLKANVVDKFRNDFKDIFQEGNAVNRPNIADLQPKVTEYQQLTRDRYLVEPRLYFLYNGTNEDAKNGSNNDTYQSYHKPQEGFEIWDSSAIYNTIVNLRKAQSSRKEVKFVFEPQNSNIVPRDHQAIYSYSIQNVRAVNFRLKAVELCRLIEKEKEVNNTDTFLFAKNIRSYLGKHTIANRKMMETIKDANNAAYFSFLNNGITIICEQLTIPSSVQDNTYLLPCRNPVIVNGLQTTNVLYEAYLQNPSDLQGVDVNVRLYETTDPELIDQITDATNTQTPIDFRDKISNKEFNKWTKEYFKLNGINYITKRGEVFDNQGGKGALQEAIDSDVVLSYWYATFYEKPEVAKKSTLKVLEDIFNAANGQHPLRALFDGDKDSPVYEQLLVAYKIYKFVNEEINILIVVLHASQLLAYGLYKAMKGNLNLVNDKQWLLGKSDIILGIIYKNTKEWRDEKIAEGKSSQTGIYFNRVDFKSDYNKAMNITESNTLIGDLLQLK